MAVYVGRHLNESNKLGGTFLLQWLCPVCCHVLWPVYTLLLDLRVISFRFFL